MAVGHDFSLLCQEKSSFSIIHEHRIFFGAKVLNFRFKRIIVELQNGPTIHNAWCSQQCWNQPEISHITSPCIVILEIEVNELQTSSCRESNQIDFEVMN